ncbi:unnamed protein product [Urochloa humidicola]
MAAADAVGKKSVFRRGINATRLALAAAVTVLIIVIVVYAIVVVSRTEKLALSVVGGVISVKPHQAATEPPTKIGLTFSIQANNPSGRVRFYYTDIHGLILLKNGTTYSVKLARFPLGKPPDMDVAPVAMLQTDADVDAKYWAPIDSYYKELWNASSSSNSSIFSDVKLQLNGSLTVGLYSVHNITSKDRTFYYCWPLTIRAAVNASADTADNTQCFPYDP